MNNDFEQIQDYPILTDAQRLQARKNAERTIVQRFARKPERDHFREAMDAKFPLWFSWLVGAFLAIVAVAAGTISGIRLYFAGRDYAALTIDVEWLTWVIGTCTFLAAELLVILATVASQVYMRGIKRWLSLLPIAIGMLVAFVGNWEITNPSTTWGWVETIFPPIAVLSVAFLFEIALIPELERRQSVNNAYHIALDDYNRLMHDPSTHDGWHDAYGWALWDMWSRVFADHDPVLLDRDTRQLIAMREIDADTFFSGEISGNFRNKGKARGNDQQVSKKDVIDFLKEHPDAENLTGTEIAEMTGASPATVSRARKAITRNGRHE